MDFKKELYTSLQKEAPFTDALRERILKATPRKKKSYTPWVVAVAICTMFFLLFVRPSTQPSPYIVSSIPNGINDMYKLLQANEIQLPFAQPQGQQQVILADHAYVNGLEAQLFSHFPYIIEEATTYKIGDYVVLQENEEYSVVQIVGVNRDKVEVRDQQVYVNDKALALPGMVAKSMDTVPSNQQVKYSFYIEYTSNSPFNPLSTKVLELGYGEVAVKESQQIEKKDMKQIVGKVVAFQDIQSTLTLSEREQALYTALKTQGIGVLKGEEADVVVKMYVHSLLEQDVEVNYTLVAYDENYRLTKEEHRQSMSYEHLDISKQLSQKIIAYIYNGIENGFMITPNDQHYFLSWQSNMGSLTMELQKNNEGVIQVKETLVDEQE